MQSGGLVLCSGRKSGPVTFRGSVTVALETQCAALLSLNVGGFTGSFFGYPSGCPKSHEKREPRLGQIIYERSYYGLDRDLDGNRAAIVRRAKSLLQAWRRGNPVARWTDEEEVFGMPLRAFEQVELEYRERYIKRFQHLVEEGDWVAENAPSSYAGYEIDEVGGGIVYVGFTVEPKATLAKLKRRLIAPERFKPFPVTPTYTEAELEKIWLNFRPRRRPLRRLVNSTSIAYLANKVEVGTEHVARVRRLIVKEYGPDAPFKVVFEHAPEALSGLVYSSTVRTP
jgi:hypothetical protein